jgi:hypothetical protein
MPVDLAIARADRSVQRLTIPVDVWLTGARRYLVRVSATPAVTSVVIDPDNLFPDINRANQTWAK